MAENQAQAQQLEAYRQQIAHYQNVWSSRRWKVNWFLYQCKSSI